MSRPVSQPPAPIRNGRHVVSFKPMLDAARLISAAPKPRRIARKTNVLIDSVRRIRQFIFNSLAGRESLGLSQPVPRLFPNKLMLSIDTICLALGHRKAAMTFERLMCGAMHLKIKDTDFFIYHDRAP